MKQWAVMARLDKMLISQGLRLSAKDLTETKKKSPDPTISRDLCKPF
jgi:hypothetical protein